MKGERTSEEQKRVKDWESELNELARLRTENEELQTANANKNKKIAKKDKENADLRAQLTQSQSESFNSEYNKLKEENSRLIAKNEKLSQSKEVMRGSINYWKYIINTCTFAAGVTITGVTCMALCDSENCEYLEDRIADLEFSISCKPFEECWQKCFR